jgi:hypothetical protein
MPPRIDQPLKREVELQGQLYTVTISSEGVSIVLKGKRSGARQMTWLELVSGEAELERDLVRSLAHRKAPLSAPATGKPRHPPKRQLKLVNRSDDDDQRA